jgi:hypothetical protein
MMTAVKGFGGKWAAVNPLDTIVFGMNQHQTVKKSKMNNNMYNYLNYNMYN